MADSRGFRESEWYARQTSDRPWLHRAFSLLADGGFALETWLQKPCSQEQLTTPMRKTYNFSVCSPQTVVENAFGLLKARWRLLQFGVSRDTEFALFDVEACVRLDNYFLDEGDDWVDTVDAREDGDATAASDEVGKDTYAQAVQMREELAQA